MIAVPLLLLFLMICMFLSASETALFSLSSLTVKSYRTSSDLRKRSIYRLLDRPKKLLVTILILNICCDILIQNTTSSLFRGFRSWVLKVGVPLFLTLFVGEIFPKTIALPYAEKVAYKVTPFLAVMEKVFAPFRIILTQLTEIVSRFLFFFFKKEKPLSLDELKFMTEASRKSGVLAPEETELLEGYFSLSQNSARELMRPKQEIVLSELEKPLFSKDVGIFYKDDEILGTLLVQEYYLLRGKELLRYLRKPHFIPETMQGRDVLRTLRSQNLPVLFVVDEYGGLSGAIFQEDLLQMLFGTKEKSNKFYTRIGPDLLMADATLPLETFTELFHVRLKSEYALTLGGWLIEQMEEIPEVGAKYVTEDFLFYVLSADPNRVRRIYVRKLR